MTYGTQDVRVRTLTSILDAACAPLAIDFLSIDCEGADPDVLTSLDLDRYQPRLICMEIAYPIPGYEVWRRTTGNTLYVQA